jgi:hypothetical protein
MRSGIAVCGYIACFARAPKAVDVANVHLAWKSERACRGGDMDRQKTKRLTIRFNHEQRILMLRFAARPRKYIDTLLGSGVNKKLACQS